MQMHIILDKDILLLILIIKLQFLKLQQKFPGGTRWRHVEPVVSTRIMNQIIIKWGGLYTHIWTRTWSSNYASEKERQKVQVGARNWFLQFGRSTTWMEEKKEEVKCVYK